VRSRSRGSRSGTPRASASSLDQEQFHALDHRFLEILDSDARIPAIEKIGPYYYNLWRDRKNPRGLWRRTTLEEYKKAKPNWEIVLDLDALGEEEKVNWVWHGAQALKPEYKFALVSLSRGGADASVVREFDLSTKSFLKDGYTLPEAKSQIAWRGPDSVFVGTDVGPCSLTTSGYPRIVKEWKRGTPLAEAAIVFEAHPDDMSVSAFRDLTPGFERDVLVRRPTFWTSEAFLRRDGKLVKIDKPDDARASLHREWLLIQLRSDWTVGGNTYPAGALLVTHLEAFL
jgi:prolyl oligopeptidase